MRTRLEEGFLEGFRGTAEIMGPFVHPRPQTIPPETRLVAGFMSDRARGIEAFMSGPLESPYLVCVYAGAIAGYAAAFGG